MPVIKRYANRKLYDTLTGRYVTLEEIGWMIQNGEDVKVVDHKSQADVTAVTLTQVIFDQEKRLGGLFPKNLFYHLIKASGTRQPKIINGLVHFFEQEDPINLEIRNRLEILYHEKYITLQDFERFTDLLLNERFNLQDINEEDADTNISLEVDSIKQQLTVLESELIRIKAEKNID